MNAITEVPNGALLSFIERAAKDESFDVAKFETLLRVRRDEANDHARRVFNQAMAACQSEMLPVLRNSPNRGVGGRYAKLEDIDQQMRPIYTRHGFSVRFGSAQPPQPGWMRITCTVAHESGYFEENYLDSPVTNQGAQGGRMAMTAVQAVGSVVTYLRRYLLGMVFNIVQADVVGVDDDGEGQRDAKPEPKVHPLMPNGPVDPNPVAPPVRAAAAAMPASPRKRQTIAEWLEAHRIALHDCQSAEEADAIIESDEVDKARRTFTNGAKQQLEDMIFQALRKWHPTTPAEDAGIDEEPEDLAALALP